MEKEAALKALQNVVNKNIRHKYYDRTCKLADKYFKWITEEGVLEYLLQNKNRVDNDNFQKVKELTIATQAAQCERIKSGFYRIGRLDSVNKGFTYPKSDADSDALLRRVTNAISQINGSDSLDDYLATDFVDTVFLDPNTFVVCDFESFDYINETPSPYLIEYGSKYAIDFKYIKNDLDYLILKLDSIKVKNKQNEDVYLEKYLLYTNDIAIGFTGVLFEEQTSTDDVFVTEDKRAFNINIYNHKATKTPAYRVGYKKDPVTAKNTFISPIHNALPYLKKALNVSSQNDIVMNKHAFPQKLQYIEPCPGKGRIKCKNGKTENGGNCSVCGGEGSISKHRNALDIITVNLPDIQKLINEGRQLPSLRNFIEYVAPEVAILDIQQNYIDKQEDKAYAAVYNTSAISKKEAITATEVSKVQEAETNTLKPFAKSVSRFWKYFVYIVACYVDSEKDIEVFHSVPSDFTIKSVEELLENLSSASDSNAPAFLKQSINRSIAAKVFIDNPSEYKKYLLKERFIPFAGKSQSEVLELKAEGGMLFFDWILYSYSDSFFDELENEVQGFIDMEYSKQWDLIKGKVNEKIKFLKEEKSNSAPSFNVNNG